MPEKPICSEIIHHEIADKNIAASDGKIHVSWKVVHWIALGIWNWFTTLFSFLSKQPT